MSIYNTYKPEGSSDGLYLKLVDGDKVKLRIMGEPAITVYKEGDRPRYAWVVWNHDKKKAQVYGAGVSVFTQLSALVEDWGEPQSFDLRVSREGSGLQDTSYTVTPVKQSVEPDNHAVAECEKVDLLQATKGRWLADYADDGILPAPLTDGTAQAPAKDVIVEVGEEPVDLADVPY